MKQQDTVPLSDIITMISIQADKEFELVSHIYVFVV